MTLLLAFLAAYLIGGFPTGILVCRVVKGVDPRTAGSGSSGATNVSRVLGKGWGLFVLLMDVAKGFLPVVLIPPAIAGPEPASVAPVVVAVGAVVGHVWTPFAGFRGGKGVATGAGAMLALDAPSMLIAFGVWLVTFLCLRIVSVATLIAALALSVAVLFLGGRSPAIRLLAVGLVVFLVFTHRSNIRRLLRREEKPIT